MIKTPTSPPSTKITSQPLGLFLGNMLTILRIDTSARVAEWGRGRCTFVDPLCGVVCSMSFSGSAAHEISVWSWSDLTAPSSHWGQQMLILCSGTWLLLTRRCVLVRTMAMLSRALMHPRALVNRTSPTICRQAWQPDVW